MLHSLTRPLSLLFAHPPRSLRVVGQRQSRCYDERAPRSLVRRSFLRHPSVFALLHHVLRGLAVSGLRVVGHAQQTVSPWFR